MPSASYAYQFYESATWQTIPEWQGFTIQIGRQFQLDTYRADTCTADFWFQEAAGYFPKLKPDVPVRIYDATRKVVLFYGFIKDVKIDYGIPYDPGTQIGNMDRMTLEAEGAFARLGRQAGEEYVMAAGTLSAQISNAQTQSGVTITAPTDAATVQMGGTTVSTTWGDWLSRAALTLNNRIRSVGDTVEVVSKYTLPVSSMNFGNTATVVQQRYGRIDFRSLADNFYTQVIVDPEGFAAATAEQGVAPFRTYQVNTLNASTAQAKDYADYLLGNYGIGAIVPGSLVALSQQQGAEFYLDNLGEADGVSDWYTQKLVGYQTDVAFRLTSYPVVIEGLTISGNPDSQSFTFYVSGQDLNAYLILDDPVFGKLDENKLGY